MPRSLLLLLGFLSIFLGSSARADVSATYDFNGVSTDYGSSFTGNMTFDLTTGKITGIAATYVTSLNGGETITFSDADVTNNQGPFFNDGYVAFINSDQGDGATAGAQLALLLPYESIANYPGSLICAYEYSCNNVISTFYTFDPGSTNMQAVDVFCTGGVGAAATAGPCTAGSQPVIGAPGSATPEPSSLVLLGAGMIGAAGVVRRRVRR